MQISDKTQQILEIAVSQAEAKQATNLIALDVSERFGFADVFLIASGEVERNVQAISDAIEDGLNSIGVKTLRREGREAGRWILLDFGDLIVHLFHEEDREHYDLERLWRDCDEIQLKLEDASLPEDEKVR
ncbi:MAG TPA: ribosome silencing factor [Microbacteriaceae bacterium]|nr:ribosome silencing factor [Microbacteriaceae bacterium]